MPKFKVLPGTDFHWSNTTSIVTFNFVDSYHDVTEILTYLCDYVDFMKWDLNRVTWDVVVLYSMREWQEQKRIIYVTYHRG